MKTCDFCGKNIVGIKEIDSISDEEDIWNKSYKILKEAKLSKINSKFKRFLFKLFGGVSMPVYYYTGIDFCDDECYSKWKDVFNSKINGELAKIKDE